MLSTDRKNRNYAITSMDDILSTIEISKENEANELKKLFNSLDYENDKIKISKNSKVYHILKKSKVVIDGDTYINSTMLAESYARASLEFNYQMKDRLFKYLKRYVDNMSEGKNNDPLIQKILCDDITMDYIHKYNNFEEYTKHLIGTRITHTKPLKVEQKSRSFVKMVS